MSDKQWLEKLIHKKYGLIPTDKAQQAIIEIEQRIKQLEDLIRRAIRAKTWTSSHPCFSELYDDLQKALEEK